MQPIFGNFWSARLNKRIVQTRIPQEWIHTMLTTVSWDKFETCNVHMRALQHALLSNLRLKYFY